MLYFLGFLSFIIALTIPDLCNMVVNINKINLLKNECKTDLIVFKKKIQNNYRLRIEENYIRLNATIKDIIIANKIREREFNGRMINFISYINHKEKEIRLILDYLKEETYLKDTYNKSKKA